jgi:hypothetical protein
VTRDFVAFGSDTRQHPVMSDVCLSVV